MRRDAFVLDDEIAILRRFLTNGGEAIPKFVFLSEDYVECGNWGPMPEECRRLIARGKACGDVPAARKKVALLYEADPERRVVIDELIAEFESGDRPTPDGRAWTALSVAERAAAVDTGAEGTDSVSVVDTGVGDTGIPLSPDTLVLPDTVDYLPQQSRLLFQAVRLLGQAYSLATAPGGSLPVDMPRVRKGFVFERALTLARQGNESFELAAETLRRARLARRKAWAALLPSISARGTFTHSDREIVREFGGESVVFDDERSDQLVETGAYDDYADVLDGAGRLYSLAVPEEDSRCGPNSVYSRLELPLGRYVLVSDLIAASRARRLSSERITVQGATDEWLRFSVSEIAAV